MFLEVVKGCAVWHRTTSHIPQMGHVPGHSRANGSPGVWVSGRNPKTGWGGRIPS